MNPHKLHYWFCIKSLCEYECGEIYEASMIDITFRKFLTHSEFFDFFIDANDIIGIRAFKLNKMP